MTMAENIRRLRKENNMTQEQLGKHLGVQKSAIRKYESGQVQNIPISSIIIMANLFGVRPSFLMGFDDEKIEIKDELWEKISQLDDLDRNKVDGFVSGLLSAEKYQTFTKIKNA